MKKIICKSCGVEFETKKACKSREPKYCSSKCYGKTMKLDIKCQLCGNPIENKHSVSIRNRKFCSNKCRTDSRKGVPLSDEKKKKLSEGRKKSEKCKGENLYNWKGGESTRAIRQKSYFYKRKLKLVKEMPGSFLAKIFKIQKGQCFFCNSDLSDYKAIEHLTPISRGGDNDIYNLVYSCKHCNSKKGRNTLEEYALKIKKPHLIAKWEALFINAL